MNKITIEEYVYDVNRFSNINDYYILSKCLNITNSKKIVTNFDEMMAKLFKPNKKYILRDNNSIIGYCIFDVKTILDVNVVHLNDLYIDEKYHNKGLSKKTILKIIEQYKPALITSKTSNPLFYKTLKNILGTGTKSYSSKKELPYEILNILENDSCFELNDSFVYKRENKKGVIQHVYDKDVRDIFSNVSDDYSKGIVVVTDNELLNKNKGEYRMNNYKIEECLTSFDEDEKANIARQCLDVANNAKFPTYYQDVYDHLFEDPSYIRVFIKDEIDNIKGFAIICNRTVLNDLKIMHFHGIVISPEAQGLGLGKEIVNMAVEKYKPDIVTAKTHNPRAFNLLCDLLDSGCDFYPNTKPIPPYIYKIVENDIFIDRVDEGLVYRNAYPDEKIQQSKRREIVNEVFENVGPYDAQAIVVVVNNNVKEKVNDKPKTLALKK